MDFGGGARELSCGVELHALWHSPASRLVVAVVATTRRAAGPAEPEAARERRPRRPRVAARTVQPRREVLARARAGALARARAARAGPTWMAGRAVRAPTADPTRVEPSRRPEKTSWPEAYARIARTSRSFSRSARAPEATVSPNPRSTKSGVGSSAQPSAEDAGER